MQFMQPSYTMLLDRAQHWIAWFGISLEPLPSHLMCLVLQTNRAYNFSGGHRIKLCNRLRAQHTCCQISFLAGSDG